MRFDKRLLTVFALGFSSGLPLLLLTSTLQAWFLTSGLSVYLASFLSLIGLPYIFRTLMAPWLDRFTWAHIGKRRGWIMLTQILLLLGFNLMAILTPAHFPGIIVLTAFLLACFSAMQDTAIDAHRIEYLPQNYHGLGASLATTGYRIALIVSGGIALIWAEKIGFSMVYHVLPTTLFIGSFAIWKSREPHHPPMKKTPIAQAYWAPLQELLSRPYIVPLCGFLLFYKAGEVFTSMISGIIVPFLINGLGFSLHTVGFVHQIGGTGSLIVGGLLAGILLCKWSLYRALWIFGLFQAITNILFWVLAVSGPNQALLWLATVADNLATGMGSTALVSLLMNIVDTRFTATQFSLLIVFTTLPRVFSGPIAGFAQTYIGWPGVYAASVLIAFGFMPFLTRLKRVIVASQPNKHDDSLGDSTAQDAVSS